MRNCIIFLFLFGLLMSCDTSDDKAVKQRLLAWDAAIDRNPAAVKDSLSGLSTDGLSRETKAYYNLLKIISGDKTYENFTTDSLINSVVKYYTSHPQNSHNYIRALIYQGIVRTRMEVSDSTVYQPLRKADVLFRQKQPNYPTFGYMINYFIGNTHYNHSNYDLADKYFHSSLHYARQEKDTLHIFDAYLALYWNEMIRNNKDKGKVFLDTLSSFYDKLPSKRYFILNAQSVYYDSRGDYETALEKEKAQLSLSAEQKEKINIASLYYVISDRYKNIGKLDSALYYGKLASQSIPDPKGRFNHVIFNNLSDIFEKKGDYKEANEYRRKSFQIYQLSEKERLNTHLIEIEKKYDLAEAENTILRTRESILIVVLICLVLLVLLIVIVTINWRNKKMTRIELMNVQHQAEKQSLQTNLLMEEANKRLWLMQLYGYISDRLASLQDQFAQLSQRYISSHPAIYKQMLSILNTTDTELKDIPESLIPDEQTFYMYTNLILPDDFLNAKEKMLLMLMTCKAGNRQIATFMNTSIESIRVRKSQLKKKMAEKGFDITCFY